MSAVDPVKRAIRSSIGLWRLREAANRVVLGPRQPAWRRFEDGEVARLRSSALPPALVATVVPTYRRPDSLRRAVDSVLAQTMPDLTVVVVDDGGGLPSLPADPRLLAVSLSRNTGIAGLVRNVGIRLTDSPVLAFLDDDNEWRPDHLDVALRALDGRDGRGRAELVYTALDRRRPDGTPLDVLGVPFDRRLLADRSYVDTNALVLRRTPGTRFSVLPRRRTTLPREDWEFVFRLSRNATVRYVPEPTVRYLVNADSYFTDWVS